jgi:hypothetical protein
MNEIPLSGFEKAIRATHGADSRLIARERVKETFQGETVWEGEVLIFELLGHESARLCYAWEVDGEVTAVLGEAPVVSAQTAVRAALISGEQPDGSFVLNCGTDRPDYSGKSPLKGRKGWKKP